MKRALVFISLLNILLNVPSFTAEDDRNTTLRHNKVLHRISNEILQRPLKSIPLDIILHAASQNPNYPFQGRQKENFTSAYHKVSKRCIRNTVEAFFIKINKHVAKRWIHGGQFNAMRTYFESLDNTKRVEKPRKSPANSAVTSLLLSSASQQSMPRKMAPWAPKTKSMRQPERKEEAKSKIMSPPFDFHKESLDLPTSHPQLVAPESPRVTSPATSPEHLSNFVLEGNSDEDVELEDSSRSNSTPQGSNSDSPSDRDDDADDTPDVISPDSLLPANLFEDEPISHLIPTNLFSDDE